MEFRDFVVNETASTIDKLFGQRRESSARDFAAFRQAVDTALSGLASGFAAARESDKAEMAALVEHLSSELTAHDEAVAEQLLSEAQKQVDEVRSERQTIAGELESERERSEAVLGDLARTRALLAEAEAAVRAAEAIHREDITAREAIEEELQHARALLDHARTESATLVDRLETSAAERASLEAVLRDAQSRLGRAEAERQASWDELAANTARLEGAARDAQERFQRADTERLSIRDELAASAARVEALDVLVHEAEEHFRHSETSRQSLREELATSTARVEALEVLVQEAEDRLRHAESSRQSLRDELATSTARLDTLDQAKRSAEIAHLDLQQKLEAAARVEAGLRERVAMAEAETRKARAEAESKARSAVDAEAALRTATARIEELMSTSAGAGDAATAFYALKFDRLIPIYQELEGGGSVPRVLTALARGLGHQFRRVALFNVSGTALQGAYQLGFDIEKDITKIVMPLSLDSVATRAVASGSIETAAPSDSPTGSQLPFGGAAGWSMAVPLALKGDTIAVIYADEGNQPSTDAAIRASRITFADLLRRHAIAVLSKLAIDLKELSELGDYATLLLDEVEYIYGSDMTSGRQNIELVERLTENLRCARETFVRRLASSAVGESGSHIFEERMNTLIDVRGASPFGRHLSIAAAAMVPVGSKRSEETAQAS